MSIFGSDSAGSVVRVTANPDVNDVIVIRVDNFEDSAMFNVPVTGYTLELSTNHQFLHTLDEFIYAFAFGDRIGELTLTGIAFTAPACSAAGAGGFAQRNITDEVKQENVYEFYLANKFSRSLRPTKIQIGGSKVQLVGFLTGMRMEVPNPQLPIMQWALRFNVVVDPGGTATTASSGGGGGGTGRSGGTGGNTRPGPGQGRLNPNNPSGWDVVDDFLDTFVNTATGVLTDTFLGD
jgi:hypothetical protein